MVGESTCLAGWVLFSVVHFLVRLFDVHLAGLGGFLVVVMLYCLAVLISYNAMGWLHGYCVALSHDCLND